MIRSVVFILLAVALATVSFGLTQVIPNPFFGYGVAFIGYSASSLLTLVAVFVRD